MKIFYDGYTYTLQKYGGISRIFNEIVNRIEGYSNDVEVMRFRFPETLKKKQSRYFIPKLGRLFRYWDEMVLPRALNNYCPDIYHPTYYRFAEPGKSKLVISVYDMIHEKYGLEPNIVKQKKKCLTRADLIMAISESTKNDIVEYYGISDKKIVVIPLAASKAFHTPSSNDRQETMPVSIPGEYLLYVGNRDGYKNFSLLLDAYIKIANETGLKLVCVGGGIWKKNEIETIRDRKLEQNVFNLQGLSDTELKTIYFHSKMFIYPSLYEGFGIPLLEAMASGTPVIGSNCSSIPEVGGHAMEYFNPTDVDDLCQKILTVNNDIQKRKSMISLGFKRAQLFTWDSTAQKTYEAYQAILK